MSAKIDVQIASSASGLPGAEQFEIWARAALLDADRELEVTVRVVDEAEGSELNNTYRSIAGPTNVLSFPFEAPEPIQTALIGDVVICAPVVLREAGEQGKTCNAHFAHMVVHGILHLLGYDHQQAPEADWMEGQERRILAALGFPDPYRQAGPT